MLLFHPSTHVFGDLVVDVDLGQVVAGPADQHLKPHGDVLRLQQLRFCMSLRYGA